MAQHRIPEVNIAGRLVLNGRTLAVGQVCENSLVLQEPCDAPETEAKLIVTVRGKEKVFDIILPHGLSAASEVAEFF
jgi:hypothetical protein